MKTKMLKEGSWTVTLTRMVGNRPDVITRDNIQASTQAEAVQKAQQGLPNAALYNQVSATQIGNNGAPMVPDDQNQTNNPNQGMSANPMGGPSVNPLQQESTRSKLLKSLSYPYVMGLPANYEKYVAEARIPALKIERRNGRIMIIVPRPEDLELFVKKLLENKSSQALELLEGIENSARQV